MANRRGIGRGTRHGKGVQSGSTFTTMPSGVTMSSQGISGSSGVISPAILGTLDSLAGPVIGGVSLTGLLVASNLTHWGGTPILIATGLSNILTFSGSYRVSATTSLPYVGSVSGIFTVTSKPTGTAGEVTAALYVTSPAGVGLKQSGGSLSWLAFGT